MTDPRKPAHIRTIAPLVRAVDTRTVRVEPKAVDPFYQTPEYLRWRSLVISRAGGRCEAIEQGSRCTKAEPAHRMFADHKIERLDGGAPYDVNNGQCLCGSHHTRKTVRARTERLGNPVVRMG